MAGHPYIQLVDQPPEEEEERAEEPPAGEVREGVTIEELRSRAQRQGQSVDREGPGAGGRRESEKGCCSSLPPVAPPPPLPSPHLGLPTPRYHFYQRLSALSGSLLLLLAAPATIAQGGARQPALPAGAAGARAIWLDNKGALG